MNTAPFFVIGTQRGGTTLLRLMLDHHSNIGVPPESHFLIPLLKTYEGWHHIPKANLKNIHYAIVNGGRFDTWKTTPDELTQLLNQMDWPTSLANIIDQVFTGEVQKQQKDCWGDKTPEYVDIFEKLGDVLPNARFVFLVRDGRDVINSLLQRGWQGWSIYQRSRYWSNAVLKMLNYKRHNPGRSILIKYEDLVKSPEKTLRQVTDFLEMPYDEGMLTYHESSNNRITEMEKKQGIHQKMNRLPKATDIQKWKKSDHHKQVFFAEAMMHRALKNAGYAVTRYQHERLLHQLRALLYTVSSQVIDFIYLGYHKLIGEGFRQALRNSHFGKQLKRMVRNA